MGYQRKYINPSVKAVISYHFGRIKFKNKRTTINRFNNRIIPLLYY